MSRGSALARLIADLRAYGGVAVIGAGISIAARYPSAAGLSLLLWHTFDQQPLFRRTLAGLLERPDGPSPTLIADDPGAMGQAWALVASHDDLRFRFQRAFSSMDADRSHQFSAAHSALAELLHTGFLELVLSANWDTQFERAYEQRYGVRPPESGYSKPQGDAAEPGARWVLPGEGRPLPDDLRQNLSRLVAAYPRALVIAGYSEQDAEIVGQVIRPFEQRSIVTRISPGASGRSAVRGRAEDVLPEVAEQLRNLDQPPWRYVNFAEQRDIGRALLGGGLGAQDVRACPEVPTVSDLVRHVRVAHSALLQGPSGSGKSLVCFQAASVLAGEGYECVQLIGIPSDIDRVILQLRALRQRTVLIVDDGEQLSDASVEALLSAGTPDHKVVVATTVDGSWGRVLVRLSAEMTVRVLQAWCLSQKATMLPLVSKLDDRVGEGYLDEPYERRVADAAASGTAWQFMFTLGGGWRRTRAVLDHLRDRDRTDLLLAAVAVGQTLTRGVGADMAWLEAAAAVLGRDAHWLDEGLKILVDERLIIGPEHWRCIHSRVAEVVIAAVSERIDKDRDGDALELFRAGLLLDAPLAGTQHLLSDIGSSQWPPYRSLVDHRTLVTIIDRCWAAGHEEVGPAAYLLHQIIGWHPDAMARVEDGSALLRDWLCDPRPEWGGGLGWLLNRISNEHKTFALKLTSELPAELITERVSSTTWGTAYGWQQLLGALASASANDWRKRLFESLDRHALTALARSATPTDLWLFDELVATIVFFRPDIAESMYDAALPTIIGAINEDPSVTNDLARTLMYSLGYPDELFGRRSPQAWQRQIARRLVAGIVLDNLAHWASAGSLREWELFARLISWIAKVDARRAKAILVRLDLNQLEVTSSRFWASAPRELSLIWRFYGSVRADKVNEVVRRHLHELRTFPWRLVVVAAEAAASWIKEGGTIDFEFSAITDWEEVAEAATLIARANPGAGHRALFDNVASLADALVFKQANSVDGFAAFAATAEVVAPGLIRAGLSKCQPADLNRNWPERMRGKAEERRAVKLLHLELRALGPPFSEVSAHLEARFPSLRRISS